MATTGILINGLRRSGTTILWETFRQNSATLCFDEPFHPRLWAGDRENEKCTWHELGTYWDEHAWSSRSDLRPIFPVDELDPLTSSGQAMYLAELFSFGPKVVIDTVRGWNRIPGVIDAMDQSPLVIHLMRSPASWVTAQMIPLGGYRLRYRLADRYRRASFFHRRGMFNYYHYRDIIDAALATNHPMWRRVALPVAELARAPAYVRLLAFWWAASQIQAETLLHLPHDRVATVTLEDFARAPEETMRSLYAKAGWEMPPLDVSMVRPTREGYSPEADAWIRAFELVGLPESLLPGRQFTAKAAVVALSAATQKTATQLL